MVIKIFYVVIAIFSVAMIFLASSDPYFAEQFKVDAKQANTKAFGVVDREINATTVSAVYEASEVNRFDYFDEFLNFKGEILRGNQKHDISSNKAILDGEILKFVGDARYENNESLNFSSQEIIYNTKSKVVASDVPFIMTQNGDKITGESGSYDLDKKQTQAKGLKAWIEQGRK